VDWEPISLALSMVATVTVLSACAAQLYRDYRFAMWAWVVVALFVALMGWRLAWLNPVLAWVTVVVFAALAVMALDAARSCSHKLPRRPRQGLYSRLSDEPAALQLRGRR
jgi:hypothetical protein